VYIIYKFYKNRCIQYQILQWLLHIIFYVLDITILIQSIKVHMYILLENGRFCVHLVFEIMQRKHIQLLMKIVFKSDTVKDRL